MSDESKEPATKQDVDAARDAIIKHIDTKVTDSVEGMRSQNSAEHSTLRALAQLVLNYIAQIMERLGFLKPRPPPVDLKGRPSEPGDPDA